MHGHHCAHQEVAPCVMERKVGEGRGGVHFRLSDTPARQPTPNQGHTHRGSTTRHDDDTERAQDHKFYCELLSLRIAPHTMVQLREPA